MNLFRFFAASVIWVGIVFSPLVGSDKSYEDIFQKIFKRPFVKQPQKFNSTMIVNGRVVGRVAIIADVTGPMESVTASAFIEQLQPFINSVAFDELSQLPVLGGYIDYKLLNSLGYQLSFNRRENTVSIKIPKDKRNPYVYVDFGSRAWRPGAPGSESMSKLSGYVNMDARWFENDTNSGAARSPLAMDMESVINSNGLVFRQIGNLKADDRVPYAFRANQVLHDDSIRWTRYQLGDLDLPARGFQRVPKIFGVGIGRMYYLNPLLIDEKMQRLEVRVPTDGRMIVTIGGILLREMDVETGIYVLENLPLQFGVNTVSIKNINADGTVEDRNFRMIREYGQIGVGDEEFYYLLGTMSQINGRDYSLGSDRSVFSGYHLVRPNDYWLQGGYLQLGNHQAVWGADTYFPGDLGIWHFDIAGSKRETSDLAALAEFTTYYDSTGMLGYQRYKATYIGEKFRRFGDSDDASLARSLSAESGINLSTEVFISARVVVEERWDQKSPFYGGGFGFSRQVGLARGYFGVDFSRSNDGKEYISIRSDISTPIVDDFSGIVQARYQKISGLDNSIIGAYITWTPKDHSVLAGSPGAGTKRLGYWYRQGDSSFETLSDLDNDGRIQGNVIYGVRNQYSDFQLNAGLSQLDKTDNSRLALLYNNTRGIVDIGYSQSEARSGSYSRSKTYRVASSIAFADGQVGVGRPIRQNFVLVYPEKGILGQTFKAGGRGVVDMFGPAVVTDLPLWTETSIAVEDITDIPEGYDMGNTRYRASLGVYSGSAIRVGNGFRVLVFGVAKMEEGPLSYVVAEVSRDGETVVLERILTGPDGNFSIQGLKPGKYVIRFKAKTSDEVYFELPDSDTERQFDLGEVILYSSEVTQGSVAK